jgi:hypothetical protein
MTNNIEKAVESARTAAIVDSTPSSVVRTVNSVPCTSWCQESSTTTWLLQSVGNDVTRTNQAIQENLKKGLETECTQCSHKYLDMATALEHHAALLRCVSIRDDKGALECTRQRAVVLKRLGFKLA